MTLLDRVRLKAIRWLVGNSITVVANVTVKGTIVVTNAVTPGLIINNLFLPSDANETAAIHIEEPPK